MFAGSSGTGELNSSFSDILDITLTNISTSNNYSMQPPNSYFNSMVYCDDNNRKEYFTKWQKIIYGTWLASTIFAASIGNLLVIVVILRNKCMRGVCRGTNMFLLSLAVADVMVGALMAPVALYTMINECWILPRILCTVNSFLNSTLLVASIHTLMYISVYKYLAIKRVSNGVFMPLENWKWNLMIILAWSWGLLLAILTTQFLSQAVYKPKTMQCGPQYPILGTAKPLFLHFLNQFINIIIPYSIMTFAYVQIYRRIKANAAVVQRTPSVRASGDSTNNDDESGVVKTLVIVLVCFLLCFLPYFIYTNYSAFLIYKGDVPSFFNPVAYCFLYMNSACNPIIYAWRFPEFRKGYKEILRKPHYIITFGPLGRKIRRPREPSLSLTTATISRPNSGIGFPSSVSTKPAEVNLLYSDRDSVYLDGKIVAKRINSSTDS